ncbi:MAG: 1,6-anhydro-N-acetylmuramyl-L-alanine amidase AmpD [Ectothiorhodospiraceae bacterium]|nr:1,6-anhydro-N-acetylmuramyl-L-alanine amidase AmpD [Ectothiorhodospiraceae bacterium]
MGVGEEVSGFRIDLGSGLVEPARQVPSPNHDERPDPEDISLLVIHCISLPPGEFSGPWIDRLFTNSLDVGVHPYFARLEGLRVSRHLLIDRHGRLPQYVPLHLRAWHAGASCWRSRGRCNDFAIGIELEGTDTDPYEPAQYRTLVAVSRALLSHYPRLSEECIVGHEDIAPGRKTDPGPAFDWQHYRSALAGACGGASS